MTDFDAIEWITANLDLKPATSGTFVYAGQDSLSNRAMPGIYCPFDPRNARHFAFRAKALDFAAVVGSGRVLDFGPGEGFPSILIAPFVRGIVGVEASQNRVDVCSANARRMGVGNAHFVLVSPGDQLPFPDESFDGAVASWSVEQSPNLHETLREIHRVLRPGSRFRFEPETLSRYAGGHEREAWLPEASGGNRALTLFDRDVTAERVTHYGLLLDTSGSEGAKREVDALLARYPGIVPYEAFTRKTLESLARITIKTVTWATRHPSLRAWPSLLREVGFGNARITYSGSWVAWRLFDQIQSPLPTTLKEMDSLLDPVTRAVVEMDAPAEPASDTDIFVTAVK